MSDNKETLIESMCMTWRHDFGIDKRYGPLGYQGMMEDERNALRSQMRQLLDHHGEQIAALYASHPAPENEAVRREDGDAERIEFLGEQAKQSSTGITITYDRHVEDGYVTEHGYRFMSRRFATPYEPTVRDAIDAAIARRGEVNKRT